MVVQAIVKEFSFIQTEDSESRLREKPLTSYFTQNCLNWLYWSCTARIFYQGYQLILISVQTTAV